MQIFLVLSFFLTLAAAGPAWAERGPSVDNVISVDIENKDQSPSPSPSQANPKGFDFRENPEKIPHDPPRDSLFQNLFLLLFLIVIPFTVSYIITYKFGGEDEHKNPEENEKPEGEDKKGNWPKAS